MNEFDLFTAALREADHAHRAELLDRECGDDLKRRRRIELLLKAHELADNFLEDAPPPGLATVASTEGTDAGATPDLRAAPAMIEGPGSRIGPYKLVQVIGEGGMGTVFMAEQETPVRRKVALKIIKPGMDSAQVIARFEAERQALALMDHPSIAKVFDAGATELGRPFFVMELVSGVPITEYCDTIQLTLKDRLQLFIPVCHAVQHAHQKGIIHRDIKPSNVLVAIQDGRPMPKVIDFGVAKAIDQRLTERSLLTQFGAIVGTLEYMSPEQAEMSALGVDTRSDIYALGVLLYELLTGSTPLERARLEQSAYAEILKRIREEEPPRPSTRLSELRARIASIAAQRKIEPSKLARLVRGDLDWIVMKTLEKDRTRRYDTASSLARDIERYLAEEAVEACPPSTTYRMRKFARRHRAALATVSALAAMLMLGVCASAWQAMRARQAERAARAERDRAVLAEGRAVLSRRETEAKRRELEEARQSLERSLYVSNIQLAQSAWNAGNLAGMRDLLQRQQPEGGEADRRSFEWYHLQRLGSSVRTSIMTDRGVGTLSPGGTRYVYYALAANGSQPTIEGDLDLRLVDFPSGRELHKFTPYPGSTALSVGALFKFSPEGTRFLCRFNYQAGEPRHIASRVKVWDSASGREVLSLSESGGILGAAAFDHKGRRLALAINRQGELGGSELNVWDLEGGKKTLTIPDIDRRAGGWSSLEFSPDGTSIAALTRPKGPSSATSPAELRVWDAASGTERFRCGTGSGSYCLAYSPDGRRLAVSLDGGTSHRVRDAATGKEIIDLTLAATTPRSALETLSFSPDGARLAAASEDGKLRIWDVSLDETRPSRRPERVLGGNSAPLLELAWSSDGRSISAWNRSSSVMTWSIAAQEEQRALRGPANATWTGATAAACANRLAAVFGSLRSLAKAEFMVWDEAGDLLFTASEDAPDDAEHASHDRQIKLSSDGTRLAYSAIFKYRSKEKRVTAHQVRVWDITAKRVVFRRDGDQVESIEIALSADGRTLATSSTTGTASPRTTSLSVWDLGSNREQLHLDLGHYRLRSMVVSPDGCRIAGVSATATAGSSTANLRVWDAVTGQVTVDRHWPGVDPGALAYSADGRLLALACVRIPGGTEIKVLEAQSGDERLSLSGHNSSVAGMAFSSDGQRLASCTYMLRQAPEIKLWDLTAGRELLTFSSPWLASPNQRMGGGPECGLSFSPDGRQLSFITGREGSEVRQVVWSSTPL